MPIIFTRIDDRLIHGQVVEGWIPFLSVSEVVVVSDAIVADDMRKTLMRLSLPEEIELHIAGAEEAAAYLKSIRQDSKRILILAASPKEIVNLIEKGLALESVNVGGMHYSIGKMQIGRAIFLDDADKNSLRRIVEHGVRLEGRGVPTDTSINIAEMLDSQV